MTGQRGPSEGVRRMRLRKTCVGIGSLVVVAAMVRLTATVSLAPVFVEPPPPKQKIPFYLVKELEPFLRTGTEGAIFTICLTIAVMEGINLMLGVILLLKAQKGMPTEKFLSYWSVSYATYHFSVLIIILMYSILMFVNEHTNEGIMLSAFEVSRLVLGVFFVYSIGDVRDAIKEFHSSREGGADYTTRGPHEGETVRAPWRRQEPRDRDSLLTRASGGHVDRRKDDGGDSSGSD